MPSTAIAWWGSSTRCPGLKHGRLLQWSHMLGVHRRVQERRPRASPRDAAAGARAGDGTDLIEWTFDPMQTLNAYLNFTKLGVVVDEYEINVYGSRRFRSTAAIPPTASWRSGGFAKDRTPSRAEWRRSAGGEPDRSIVGSPRRRCHPRCRHEPCAAETYRVGFTEMLAQAPSLAPEWRLRRGPLYDLLRPRYEAVGFAEPRCRQRHLLTAS